MADVVLFRPKEYYSPAMATFRPPLGLLHVAAALTRAGFSVTILDAETMSDWRRRLAAEAATGLVLAGVTAMTGHQIQGALAFAAAVREVGSVPVVWGGLHASLLPEETLRHALADGVVQGEGEAAFVDIAQRVRKGASPAGLPGVFWKEAGAVVAPAEEAPFLELDELPLPDYSLIDVEHYASAGRDFGDGPVRCLDLNTDRGCPNRCAFCYNLQVNRRRWRPLGASRVVAAAAALAERYRLGAVNFVSDNFFVDPERVAAVCAGLLARALPLRWHADMRVDTFLRYDERLLMAMRESGCTRLTFGVESGSDRVLAQIAKDIAAADVVAAHARVRRLGFRASYHFMVGFPEETGRDIEETLRLVAHLLADREHAEIVGPSLYVPYPGTPLYERAVEMGYVSPGSLEAWIGHDWQQAPAFPWFGRAHRRYLREVRTVVHLANVPRAGLLRRALRLYGKARLSGLVRGWSLMDLDTALARRFREGGLRRRVLQAAVGHAEGDRA